MRKIKLFLAGILICSGVFASEKDEVQFLDQLYMQKKYSMALEESNAFIRKYPKSKYLKNIKIRMGQVLYVEGNYREAIDVFNSCLKELKLSNKEGNVIYLYITKSYVGLKDFSTANRAAELINRNESNGNACYEEALIAIGKGYMENEQYGKAQEEFSRVVALNGSSYDEATLNLALAAYNNSQYVKTIVYLDEYYKGGSNDENSALVNYMYGSSYYKTNEDEKALNYFRKSRTGKGSSEYKGLSTLNMIEIYMKRGEVGQAEQILSGLKGQPELYNKALKSFADYYLANGDSKKAERYYNQMTNSDDIDVIYGSAVAQYKANNYDAALVGFRKLYSTKYKNESVYYQMASEFAKKNYNWVITNKGLADGLNLTTDQSEAINSLIGASAFEIGNYKMAEDYYEKSYLANPNKESLYRLVVAASKNKDGYRLNKYLSEYKSKYPADQEYKKNLTIIEATQMYNDGKGNDSIELYKEYLKKDKNPEVVSKLIETMIAQKRYSEVMEYLNMQDSSDENLYLKGIAAMGMGKYDEADGYFNEVLRENTTATSNIVEKAKYNRIKNNFLWEKYPEAIKLGEEYIANGNLFGANDVIDKIAISYYRIDNPAKAREYFTKLESISALSDYAKFQIAETYYSEKNYKEAIKQYEKCENEATSLEYKEKGAYWQLSCMYLLKDTKGFEIKSKEFVEKYPNSRLRDNLALMKGEMYITNGNKTKGIENYEELYNQTQDKNVKEKSLTKILDLSQETKNYKKEESWINKLSNDDKKSYYLVKMYKRQNKMEKAEKELNKLIQTEEYKDFAAVELGDYQFNKKQYTKALDNYNLVLNMKNSYHKDRALYQVANIQRATGKNKEAVVTYTKVYVLYPNSEYALESKIRSAEVYETLGKVKDAITQYKELLNVKTNNKEYFLEKLIYLNLKVKNQKEAKKYYEMLKKKNAKLSEKYKDFFNGGAK